MTRRDAIALVFTLAQHRRRSGAMLMKTAPIPFRQDLPEPTPPSPEWLNGITDELGLRISRPQELETAHPRFCDFQVISSFLVTFTDVISGYNPLLIFDMNEAQVTA
jgi:hypothetical protein